MKNLVNQHIFRLAFLTLLIGFILPNIAGVSNKGAEKGRVKRIVIDAGHGGKDTGNLGTGRYKHKEKHISLEVALMVGNYIKEYLPDVEVIYTRDSDEFVGLKERAAMANRADADLFLSIHCNAHTSGNAYGTETFVMGLTREKANLDIARKENSVIFLEDDYETTYEGYDPNDPQGAIMASLTSNTYLDQSALLAKYIQDQFRERVNRHDRGVKQSVLYVLDFSAMPSVLIELGFLTNKKEEDFLNTKNGKELMASAIYRAFRDYKLERDELYNVTHTTAPDTEIADKIEPNKTPEKKPAEIEAPAEVIAEIQESENEVVYKIQIATSQNDLPLVPQNFNGLNKIEMYKDYKLYKYTYGRFTSFKEATNAMPLVKEKGFKDAFIVAFYKGERIDINKAIEIQP